MHLAHALPWWLAVLLIAGIGAATFVEYRRPLSPLTRVQRGTLAALRASSSPRSCCSCFDRSCCCRSGRSARRGRADPDRRVAQHAAHRCRQPVAHRPRGVAGHVRSAAAARQPFLDGGLAVGEGLTAASPDRLQADAPRTDLSGALAAVRERYRGQRDRRDRASSLTVEIRRLVGRVGQVGRVGRAGQRNTGYAIGVRLARRSARSGSARGLGGRRSAARSGQGRSARHRDQLGIRPHAVRAAAARQRPGPRNAAHRARPPSGSPIDELFSRLRIRSTRRSTPLMCPVTRRRRSSRTTRDRSC